MNIDNTLSGLIEMIKSSPEFQRLKQAKSVISKKPNLKRELEEFNKSQKQLFQGKVSPKDAEAGMKQLNLKLESLSKIPEVKEYLNALNALNQLMAKINGKISEALEKSLQ